MWRIETPEVNHIVKRSSKNLRFAIIGTKDGVSRHLANASTRELAQKAMSQYSLHNIGNLSGMVPRIVENIVTELPPRKPVPIPMEGYETDASGFCS